MLLTHRRKCWTRFILAKNCSPKWHTAELPTQSVAHGAPLQLAAVTGAGLCRTRHAGCRNRDPPNKFRVAGQRRER